MGGSAGRAAKDTSQGDDGMKQVTARAEQRVGKVTITGRYHRAPKKFEDDYEALKEVLGSGYNGEVYLANSRSSGEKFAIKAFKMRGVAKDKREELETEAEIFLAMDHPHVARLVDVYESTEKLTLVMECMSGGELFDRVVEKKRFSEKDAADTLYQILLAINYIHSHGIVHRDVKLENFLYEAKGAAHLKLIDFGFSKIWPPNTTMSMSCGTLAYVAPEVLDQRYTSQCDLWSTGVVAFILLFGYMPFAGSESKQIKDIQKGTYGYKQHVWKKVSLRGQDFVKKLLVVDPAQRMTAKTALEHEWLTAREKHPTVVDDDLLRDLCNFGQASIFRRACMGVMAWSLSTEERKQVREAFLELDTTRSGTITLPEFKQALASKFKLNDEALEKAFKALDANHTDEIHYSEFLAAMVSSRVALHDGLLKETFRRFDTDNSGFISPQNLREVLGESVEGHVVEELMQEADLAKSGKISYEEFITYLKGGMGSVQDNHALVAAQVIDKELEKTVVESEAEIPKMQIVPVARDTPKPLQPQPGSTESDAKRSMSPVSPPLAAEIITHPVSTAGTSLEDTSRQLECCHVAACKIQ
eukprot:TRINITY_DN103367_c0_g1_i1.p1 TRINITY_DN103367_c0_g1~~TRINITY_DN103367_c0_g1_i1.p1  ORF type:complete len:606 (+),score=136.76 TRINITY_DN103367_c0_g1_i1:60-1820(+)